MNTWYSQGRMSADHRSELLAEVERNRQVRSSRKELRPLEVSVTAEFKPVPRWSLRKLVSALTRGFRPLH